MGYKIFKENNTSYFLKVGKQVKKVKKDDFSKKYKRVGDIAYARGDKDVISKKYNYLVRNLKNIQKEIGYNFKNADLLKYAFLRDGAAEVLNISGNCEVLEFIGDRVLYCVSFKKNIHKIMNDKKAFLSNESSPTFKLLFRENTNATYLEIIKDSNLDKYIVGTSTSEITNAKTIADLYEAIIGAVAIDSNWNADTIYKVSEKLRNNVPKGKGLLARITKMGY